MPLHDWGTICGWEGVHHLWMTELLRSIKPQLPEGYRAYIGSAPLIAIGGPEGKPDVGVRTAVPLPEVADARSELAPGGENLAPDVEVAVATLEPTHSLFVAREGWLVAAVELVSPRNKERLSARSIYTTRYTGYLLNGVHLLLVDVHPRPTAFSFADEIARELQLSQPPLPAPFAVTYRVGEPVATGGSFLAIWRRPLQAGTALPTLPLPLTVHTSIPVALEQSYMRAAADAYLV
jgi:Protein of unknown function (DUF4058)